ncbi:uncharacterized protein DDB_G0271670-like [Octopus sinensis]|uniref:Uncharacterized protein DDB_G0271670-like n=1 Tax=Octopus sinensis TaxID=2607531 RepID=A0A7E6EG57_9MOLL|nr:uncharacterized protein DDB_G0271670-like [Octopus sinensis]
MEPKAAMFNVWTMIGKNGPNDEIKIVNSPQSHHRVLFFDDQMLQESDIGKLDSEDRIIVSRDSGVIVNGIMGPALTIASEIWDTHEESSNTLSRSDGYCNRSHMNSGKGDRDVADASCLWQPELGSLAVKLINEIGDKSKIDDNNRVCDCRGNNNNSNNNKNSSKNCVEISEFRMEKEASEMVMFFGLDLDCYNNNNNTTTINNNNNSSSNNSNNKIRDEKVAAMRRRQELEDRKADFTNSATSRSMTAATSTSNKNNNIRKNNKVEVYDDDDDDDDDCGDDVSEGYPPTASPTDSCSSLLLLPPSPPPPPPTDAAAAAASLHHLTLTPPSTTNSSSSSFGSAAAPQFLTSAKLSEREAINMSTTTHGQRWTQLSPSSVYTLIYSSPLNKSHTNIKPLLLPSSLSSSSAPIPSSSSSSISSTSSSSTTASSSSPPSITSAETPSELSPLPPPPPPPPSSSSASSSPQPPPPVVEAMLSPTGTAPSDLPKSPSFPVASTTVPPRIQCSKSNPMLTLNRLSNSKSSSFNYHGSGFGSWTKYLLFVLLVVVQLFCQPVDSAQPRTQRSAGTNIQKKGMGVI